MKQTAFVPVTILAGLAVVFLAPQWRLSAEEPPRLQQQGNRPRKERAPDRPDRGREPMHDHKQFSNEGGPIMDHLMRRFDEVITRLDRIEHRVGGGHNPNGYRPPHGPEHFGNEERMKEEGPGSMAHSGPCSTSAFRGSFVGTAKEEQSSPT